MKYKVFIERTERYSHQVTVDAESTADAERKVRAMDATNAFGNEWNELQPAVDTTYEAEAEEAPPPLVLWALVKTVKDAGGNWGVPCTRVFRTREAAADVMARDYELEYVNRYGCGEEAFDASDRPSPSDLDAWIVGSDDSEIRWHVSDAGVAT